LENEFKNKNNEKYGYERFDYLYLEDTLTENERLTKIVSSIENFFEVNG